MGHREDVGVRPNLSDVPMPSVPCPSSYFLLFSHTSTHLSDGAVVAM